MRRAVAIGSVTFLVGGIVAVLLVRAVGDAGVAGLAAAGVPALPTSVFTEDFESVKDPLVAQLLNTYTGPAPASMTYTADATWINSAACNGIIAAYNTTNRNGLCDEPNYNLYARGGARAVGSVSGGGDDNQVMVDTTVGTQSKAGAATLQTVKPVALSGPNRFVAFAVDVASLCNVGYVHPLLTFFLIDGANEIKLNEINPCLAPGGKDVTVEVPSYSTFTWRAGRYATNSAVLFPGTEIGFKITNAQTGTYGNDYVIDNIQVLDATPALDKSFSPPSVAVGAPSTLTFTITNTSELGAKSGWSFIDNLPAGLVVAPTPNASTTCSNGTTTAASGGSSVQVGGDLNVGQTTCTASVDVVSLNAGAYTNGSANVTSLVGLNPPAQTAALEVFTPALQTTTSTSIPTTSTTGPTSTTSTSTTSSSTSTSSTTSTTSSTSSTSVPPLNQLLSDVGRLLGVPATTVATAPTTTSSSTTSTTRPTPTTSAPPRGQLPATGPAHQIQLWGLLMLVAGGASRFLAQSLAAAPAIRSKSRNSG